MVFVAGAVSMMVYTVGEGRVLVQVSDVDVAVVEVAVIDIGGATTVTVIGELYGLLNPPTWSVYVPNGTLDVPVGIMKERWVPSGDAGAVISYISVLLAVLMR